MLLKIKWNSSVTMENKYDFMQSNMLRWFRTPLVIQGVPFLFHFNTCIVRYHCFIVFFLFFLSFCEDLILWWRPLLVLNDCCDWKKRLSHILLCLILWLFLFLALSIKLFSVRAWTTSNFNFFFLSVLFRSSFSPHAHCSHLFCTSCLASLP